MPKESTSAAVAALAAIQASRTVKEFYLDAMFGLAALVRGDMTVANRVAKKYNQVAASALTQREPTETERIVKRARTKADALRKTGRTRQAKRPALNKSS